MHGAALERDNLCIIIGMMGVYILRCGDGSYYVGSTRDIERRLAEHMAGYGGRYTAQRLPIELVFFEEFDRIDDAYAREKQLQGWSRSKREALIASSFAQLPELSRKKFRPR